MVDWYKTKSREIITVHYSKILSELGSIKADESKNVALLGLKPKGLYPEPINWLDLILLDIVGIIYLAFIAFFLEIIFAFFLLVGWNKEH